MWGAPLLYNDTVSPDMEPHPLVNRIEMKGGFLTCCELNFRDNPRLDEIGSDDILNVDTVLQTLAAINHVYCRKRGLDPEERLPLAIHRESRIQDRGSSQSP